MNAKPLVCREIQVDLVAAATGDAGPAARVRVERHVAACPPCRGEFHQYRAIDTMVVSLREAPLPGGRIGLARVELESRLADLKRRLVAYGVFPSPLGRILIARSDLGVSLVEYLEGGKGLVASRLGRAPGIEAVEDGAEVERLYWELLEYLEGRRTRLEWPLDFRLARSEFHRAVLEVTAGIPYGAVVSYAGVARDVGRPAATRAVAQALRWNPLPIVVPCHRVIGGSGDLTGYAGNKVGLKQRLLALEGVPTARARGDLRVEREAMYVRNRDWEEYCLPTCGSLPAVPLSRLTLFASRERAEAVGLAPCTSCRPDLHPLAR
ncbi:MAG: methylated-DNA--[protein]-cysteine S-methyltransferase [Candidatus Rokubacteria bacterium]|nr:methylated-DNA--[protein]-cysteine S-methyltransferase [Candidatus Rokubacteria bacterium]